MMKVVKASAISAADARQTGEASLERLKQALGEASNGVSDAIAKDVDRRDDHTRGELTEIRDRIDELQRGIQSAQAKDLDTFELNTRTEEIMRLFGQVDRNVRFRRRSVVAENKTVLAHSIIGLIADANAIARDPDKGLNVGESFAKMREDIAAEIAARIPTFLGYRVETRADPGGIIVRLAGSPPLERGLGISPAEALRKEVEEIIVWELRKMGYTVQYDIDAYDDGPNKLVTCEIKLVPPGG